MTSVRTSVPQIRQGRPGAPVDVVRVVALHGAPRRRDRSSGRVVTIRPIRTPARMRVTRSAHIRPHSVAVDRAAGPERRDAVPEQQLGAVDVADAGEHRLVHQQRADRRPAPGDAPVREPRRRPAGAAGRARAGPGSAVDLGRGQHLARGRAAQVGPHAGRRPGPSASHRIRRAPFARAAGPGAAGERAVQARGARAGCRRRSRRTGACRRRRPPRAPGRRAGRRPPRSAPAGW